MSALGNQALSQVLDEEEPVGWIVTVSDPTTNRIEAYGAWLPAGEMDATAWAERHVEQFTRYGDEGVALRYAVLPLYRPAAGY